MNKNELYLDFYKYIDNIIYNIHNNDFICSYLYYTKYIQINNDNAEFKFPLTICLGGSAYIQYAKIFNFYGLNDDIIIETLDYDFSFSINRNIYTNDINKFINEIKNIINSELLNYKYLHLDSKIFMIDYIINNQRIHIRLNCLLDDNKFHILELSFWLNCKISDNFTINDFKHEKLILYQDTTNNNVYYYLLPLYLLVKTTFYAILDFFERRYFEKCIKYINRITFIKNINKKFINLKNKDKILYKILDEYKTKIKRKYKIINDYPFILAKELVKIKNNGIIKCIYKDIRKKNRNEYKDTIIKYYEKCKNEKKYNPKLSEITLSNTDE